jgi:hypothetical protein
VSSTGAAPANAAAATAASGTPADGAVTPPSPGQDITPADVAALTEVVDPGGALMPHGTDAPSDTFDPKADAQAADDLNFLETSANNAELQGKSGGGNATPAAPGSDGPPRPPTPGQPGTLNMEGEGWANSNAESPDEFAEGWVGNTGVIGTPGSVRQPPPPPGAVPPPTESPPKPPTASERLDRTPMGEGWAGTHAEGPDEFAEGWVGNTGLAGTQGSISKPPQDPETAIKEEATNILEGLDPDPPKPPPKVDPNA